MSKLNLKEKSAAEVAPTKPTGRDRAGTVRHRPRRRFSKQLLINSTLVGALFALCCLHLLRIDWSDGFALCVWATCVIACFLMGEVVRRRFQLSLRIFLLAMGLFGAVCALFGNRYFEARRTSIAVSRVLSIGGSVDYDFQYKNREWFKTRGGLTLPTWLCSVLEDPFFARVVKVQFGLRATDNNIATIDFTEFKVVEFWNSPIGDATLAHLARFKGLRHLYLAGTAGTQISDAGLKCLAGLEQLGTLSLPAGISDAGLNELRGQTSLRLLVLSPGTNTTAQGVFKLQQALPECRVYQR